MPTRGEVLLDGTRIATPEDVTGHLGFVPQFSIARPQLTVRQSLNYARRLFAKPDFDEPAFNKLLEAIGLSAHLDKKVAQLSGGQLRRLGLALELVPNPSYLFCDEVTSGLDPQSEEEILLLLKNLAESGVTVVCVIHNLAQLYLFDCIHMMKAGRLVFKGSYDELLAHYQTDNPCKVYTRSDQITAIREPALAAVEARPAMPFAHTGFATQLNCLLLRRLTLLIQDRQYLWLTALLTFGFPVMVVIFALQGLPQMSSLSADGSFIDQIVRQIEYSREAIATGSLVSGLIMFQVILLTLMGSNNGAREIAAERHFLDKEKLSGLNIHAYIVSKCVFLLLLSLAQGGWMTVFVKYVCQFPGNFLPQLLILTATVFSMSCVSLAIGACSKSPEKASLIATYLVGFQLPLSGVVLALPDFLVWVFRPFIAAYWGWSGYLHTLLEYRFYDAVVYTLDPFISSLAVCMLVLILHATVSYCVTVAGVRKTH